MESRETKRRRGVLLIVGLAVLAALAWWRFAAETGADHLSPDAQVAELQRAALNARPEDSARLKKQYFQLTAAQRHDFDCRKTGSSTQDQERKLREFFKQPEEEQRRQIDREVDAIEAKRRAARQKEAARGAEQSGKKDASTPQQIRASKQEWNAGASPELRSMMTRRIQMLNQRLRERGMDSL